MDDGVLIAGLCDALKRLERALETDDPEERSYLVGEARKRRQQVEKDLLK